MSDIVDIFVRISVPADWERRLDMQQIIEREIHADRWLWCFSYEKSAAARKELAAAREDALENAAKVCDLLLDHSISSEWSRGTHDCAAAIRALKEESK